MTPGVKPSLALVQGLSAGEVDNLRDFRNEYDSLLPSHNANEHISSDEQADEENSFPLSCDEDSESGSD